MRFAWLGWIKEQYIDPVVHFPYAGFEWAVSLGDPGMYVLFGVMTLAAAGIALGAWYRINSVVERINRFVQEVAVLVFYPS